MLPTLVAVGVTLRLANRARKAMHAAFIGIFYTPLIAALVAALIGGIVGALFGGQQSNDQAHPPLQWSEERTERKRSCAAPCRAGVGRVEPSFAAFCYSVLSLHYP